MWLLWQNGARRMPQCESCCHCSCYYVCWCSSFFVAVMHLVLLPNRFERGYCPDSRWERIGFPNNDPEPKAKAYDSSQRRPSQSYILERQHGDRLVIRGYLGMKDREGMLRSRNERPKQEPTSLLPSNKSEPFFFFTIIWFAFLYVIRQFQVVTTISNHHFRSLSNLKLAISKSLSQTKSLTEIHGSLRLRYCLTEKHGSHKMK